MAKHNNGFKILSHREEMLLNEEEITAYYSELREYCKSRRLTNTTFAATKIGPILKKPTEAIARAVCKVLAGGEVKIVVDGTENILMERSYLQARIKALWMDSCGFRIVLSML